MLALVDGDRPHLQHLDDPTPTREVERLSVRARLSSAQDESVSARVFEVCFQDAPQE